jgi:hypothetical protein
MEYNTREHGSPVSLSPHVRKYFRKLSGQGVLLVKRTLQLNLSFELDDGQHVHIHEDDCSTNHKLYYV